MMVIGIVAIITMVAASFYGDNVIAAKRSDGRRGLQDIATSLEKCKSLYGNYSSPNCAISNGDTVPSPEGLYDIAVTSAASTFSLTATPSAGSSQSADNDCTSITLDNLGQRGGTGADPTVCW
jgi:type IV pilus assembly protein PilE